MKSRNKKQENYTIPELSIKEIKDYFSDQQIQINTSDLIKPTLESTIKLFEQFLEFFTGQNFPDIFEEIRNNSENLEYEDTLYLVGIFRSMNELLKSIGVNDFSIKDMLKPDQKKITKIFSILVSFSMFRDMRAPLYKDAVESVENIHTEVENFKQELEDLVLLNKNTEEEHDKLALEFINLENEEESLRKNCEELTKFLEESYSKYLEIEKENENLKDTISTKKLELETHKQEIKSYQSFLVSNPDELKREVNKLSEDLKKKERGFRNLGKEYNDLIKKIEKLKQIHQSLTEINNLKNTLENAKEDYDRFTEENVKLGSIINENEASIKSLKIKYDHEMRKRENLKQKLTSHKEKEKLYLQNFSAEVKEAKKAYEEAKLLSETFSKKQSEIEKKKNELEHRIFELYTKKESEYDEIVDLFYKIKEAVSANVREASVYFERKNE